MITCLNSECRKSYNTSDEHDCITCDNDTKFPYVSRFKCPHCGYIQTVTVREESNKFVYSFSKAYDENLPLFVGV